MVDLPLPVAPTRPSERPPAKAKLMPRSTGGRMGVYPKLTLQKSTLPSRSWSGCASGASSTCGWASGGRVWRLGLH